MVQTIIFDTNFVAKWAPAALVGVWDLVASSGAVKDCKKLNTPPLNEQKRYSKNIQ